MAASKFATGHVSLKLARIFEIERNSVESLERSFRRRGLHFIAELPFVIAAMRGLIPQIPSSTGSNNQRRPEKDPAASIV